jgi:hypothetical protein
LVKEKSNAENPEKPGFQRKQINPQQPYPLRKIWLFTIYRLREKPGFSREIHDYRAE